MPNYFSRIATNDRKDHLRGEKSRRDREEGDDSLLDVEPFRQLEEGNSGSQLFTEDGYNLEDLDLPLSSLTRGEHQVLRDALDADTKGFTRASKEGRSLKDYWGEAYDRKIKMLGRAKTKLKLALAKQQQSLE